MKKYLRLAYIGITIGIATFVVTTYALINGFSFDSANLKFSLDSKRSSIVNSFNKQYNLEYSMTNDNDELEEKIKNLSKKTTYLLLGDMNSTKETSEEYFKRHKDYYELAAYKYFPKDKNTNSGYDETIDNYQYAVASELAIPQLFNQLNDLDVVYYSYGDIRVTVSNNLVLSTVTLPNVKIKEQNENNSTNYDLKETNLVLYYYFIEIDNVYRLAYLHGETTDNLNKYFTELEDSEDKDTMAMAASYESNLSGIYNFDKLNNMSNNDFDNIYNSNIQNIVYLAAYYNNRLTSTANGFFINDGLVVTTWSFLEETLKDSQYITIKGNDGRNYQIDGIVTANPETDIAVIKLQHKNGTSVTLGDCSKLAIEDPVVTISSKSGTGLIMQKGIVLANDEYIQTSIPLAKADEGSPLFDKNGHVVGINTSKSTNTSISISSNSKVLKEINDKFNKMNFDSIETISFEKLKEDYYYVKYNEEQINNSIPKQKWKYYSKIGNIEKNIKLELVKASYKDKIVSLRYKNNISKYIQSMQFASVFKEQLITDGYEELVSSDSKCIYENKKYRVVIMSEFDYLIVVMVKL